MQRSQAHIGCLANINFLGFLPQLLEAVRGALTSQETLKAAKAVVSFKKQTTQHSTAVISKEMKIHDFSLDSSI